MKKITFIVFLLAVPFPSQSMCNQPVMQLARTTLRTQLKNYSSASLKKQKINANKKKRAEKETLQYRDKELQKLVLHACRCKTIEGFSKIVSAMQKYIPK
jgi:hypothetical protein